MKERRRKTMLIKKYCITKNGNYLCSTGFYNDDKISLFETKELAQSYINSYCDKQTYKVKLIKVETPNDN